MNGGNGNYTACESRMYVYLGGVDDSANWSFSFDVSSGITGSFSGSKYTVDTMDTDTGYVDITASRTGFSDITRRFSLSKSKQGAGGSRCHRILACLKRCSSQENQASVYVPATVTFSSKSQQAMEVLPTTNGRFVISESTDGLAWTVKYTSVSDEHTKDTLPLPVSSQSSANSTRQVVRLPCLTRKPSR